MQITPHFRSKEFNCKDGTPVPNQYMPNVKALAQQLEVLRAALGNKPIIITSGYRTPAPTHLSSTYANTPKHKDFQAHNTPAIIKKPLTTADASKKAGNSLMGK